MSMGNVATLPQAITVESPTLQHEDFALSPPPSALFGV